MMMMNRSQINHQEKQQAATSIPPPPYIHYHEVCPAEWKQKSHKIIKESDPLLN